MRLEQLCIYCLCFSISEPISGLYYCRLRFDNLFSAVQRSVKTLSSVRVFYCQIDPTLFENLVRAWCRGYDSRLRNGNKKSIFIILYFVNQWRRCDGSSPLRRKAGFYRQINQPNSRLLCKVIKKLLLTK